MRIVGISYHLASQIETNSELKKLNPNWQMDALFGKTGIARRHVSNSKETALQMGVEAGKKLLSKFKDKPPGGLIYITQSPDSLIPTTACLMHEKLDLPPDCFAFDLNQGCSGFVYGLSVASSLLESGDFERCLIICSETYTKYISKQNRTCRPIFSDGASAVMLEKNSVGNIGPFVFATDGSGAPNLTLREEEETDGSGLVLFMNGPKVMLFTMSAVPKAVNDLLTKSDLAIEEIDLFVFHQASKLVLDNIQEKLKIDSEKLFRNYENIGNTVSATIPIAFKQAEESGRIKNDMVILLMGFGVGYSLAGCILRT